MSERLLARENFGQLFEAQGAKVHRAAGPTVRDDVIVYDRLGAPEDLPVGRIDEQPPGRPRLRRQDDESRGSRPSSC